MSAPVRIRSRYGPPDSLMLRGVRLVAAAAVAVLCAAVVAYLATTGHPEIALALLLAPPLAAMVLRYPLLAVALWLVVTPFLVESGGGAIRMVYWLVHRALPVVVLANILIGAKLGVREPPPRLRMPELAMAGYLTVSEVMIMHTSNEVMATTYHLYDRVFIPMCLYLIVRYTQPSARDLRRVVPILIFLLFSQAAIGVLQWAAPQALPSFWLDRVGLRTIGTLDHPNVYGTTMLFAGLLLLYVGMSREPGDRRWRLLLLFPVSLVFVFLTYSRASWLAGIVVIAGLSSLYPRYIARLVLIGVLLCAALLASGRIDQQVQVAQARFRSEHSEESALSRLPVFVAAVRMFGDRPLLGWGYGNFDRYDDRYQSAVGGLVVPEKDHASHNLYLTLLAEQGVVGFLLYIGPALWWLGASARAWRTMPDDGVVNRRLLVCLWLVPASHVVVNNYSNMRIVFGLGIWWLTLGMIGSLVTRAAQPDASDTVDGWSLATGDVPLLQPEGPVGRR